MAYNVRTKLKLNIVIGQLDRPKPHSVHLWLIPQSALPSFSNVASFFLGAEERIHAARYTELCDASEYAQKKSAVRFLLASYIQKIPAKLRFRYGSQRKPFLVDGDGIEFNIAHTHGFTVVAVTQSVPIGVDIEYIKSRPRDELAMRILGATAAEEYRAMDDHGRSISFSIAWCEREALSKMLGCGIGNGWASIHSIFSSHSLATRSQHRASRIINGHNFYYLNILPSYALVFCANEALTEINVNYLLGYDFFKGAHIEESLTLRHADFH